MRPLTDMPDPSATGVTPPGDAASRLRHVVLVGNSPPRRCGIATFTSDCRQALIGRCPGIQVDLYAVDDRSGGYDYPPEVCGTIAQQSLADYVATGRAIEKSGAEILWLQHEFGIFGGAAGSHIFALLDQVSLPIVATLHTVLAAPNDEQRAVMLGLIDRASSLVVMAQYARGLLVDLYGADPAQIEVVPHGIPDKPFSDGALARAQYEWSRPVVMTFGLLSPNKGIERMLDALPEIVGRFPELLYVVVGATHPHLIASQGEDYRDGLKQRADRLGVAGHVRWVDAFLEIEDLLEILSAADVYVTPYLDPGQVTSGTLAYAVGLGKAVVSTPYVHAREILADGCGRLVPFDDADALAAEIIDLLSQPAERFALRRRAYALSRGMTWSHTASSMMRIFLRALANDKFQTEQDDGAPRASGPIWSTSQAHLLPGGLSKNNWRGAEEMEIG